MGLLFTIFLTSLIILPSFYNLIITALSSNAICFLEFIVGIFLFRIMLLILNILVAFHLILKKKNVFVLLV